MYSTFNEENYCIDEHIENETKKQFFTVQKSQKIIIAQPELGDAQFLK